MWGPCRWSFLVHKARILTSKLNHIRFGALWVKFLIGHIYSSLASALCMNQAYFIHISQAFLITINSIWSTPAASDGNKQCAFYTGDTARTTHHCRLLHFNDHNTMCDLGLINHALTQDTPPKSSPIAHLIPQIPIGISCSNSIPHATSRHLNFATFWWNLEWLQRYRHTHTIHHITGHNKPHIISINALKQVMQLISMLGCYLHIHDLGANLPYPHPIFLLGGNNTQGTRRAAQ